MIVSVSTAIGDAEHALHAANRAADACADGTTNHTTNWPGGTLTTIRTFTRTTDDALRMRREWSRKHGQKREGPEKASPLRDVRG